MEKSFSGLKNDETSKKKLLFFVQNTGDFANLEDKRELSIIEAVKKRREELGINPNKLSLEIGLVRDFVRKTEAYTLGYKYNSNHLNELAKILDCSIADFYPPRYVEENCIEEYHEIRDRRRQELKK